MSDDSAPDTGGDSRLGKALLIVLVIGLPLWMLFVVPLFLIVGTWPGGGWMSALPWIALIFIPPALVVKSMLVAFKAEVETDYVEEDRSAEKAMWALPPEHVKQMREEANQKNRYAQN